jgi:hypothetical protein
MLISRSSRPSRKMTIHRVETTKQIMPGARSSKSPPCRRNRDKSGAPDFRWRKDGPAPGTSRLSRFIGVATEAGGHFFTLFEGQLGGMERPRTKSCDVRIRESTPRKETQEWATHVVKGLK